MIREMMVTASKALLVKIKDGGKYTEEHLSSARRILGWDNTSDADHAAGMFKISVNDTAEGYFGTMIGQLRYYGKIGLTNYGGVSQVIVNGIFPLGFDTD